MHGGMDNLSSIKAVINLWPTRAAFAQDMCSVNRALPVTVHQAHKWAEKGAIPANRHQSLIRAAALHGFPVTAELIVRLHDSPSHSDPDTREDAA